MTITQRLGNDATAERMSQNARRWQNECFMTWVGLEDRDLNGNIISTEGQRMTGSIPTGAGKTWLFIMAAKDWLYQHEDGVVVVVAPGGNLCNQHHRSCRQFGLYFNRYFTGFQEVTKSKGYITTYHSLKHLVNLKHVKDKKVLLILDECHKAGAEKAQQVLSGFQGDACLMLSATPERSDGVDVMEMMNAPILFERNLMEIEREKRGSRADDFRLHVVEISPTAVEAEMLAELNQKITKAYHSAHSAVAKAGGNTQYILARYNFGLGSDVTKPLSIYQWLTQKRKRIENEAAQRYDLIQHLMQYKLGNKMMVFHHSIYGVERIAEMARNNGINPHIYHSGVTAPTDDYLEQYPELNNPYDIDRIASYGQHADASLARWKRSSSDILLSVKALNTGIDVPDVDAVILLSGTNNPNQRVQTIGRLFRGEKTKEAWMVVLKHSGDTKSLDRIRKHCGFEYGKHIVFHEGSSFSPTIPSQVYEDIED